MSKRSLDGAVALVTGANRGIGAAFVDALLEAGVVRVHAGARDPDTLAALVERHADRVVPHRLDVTRTAEVAAVAAAAADTTLLVNNAGVFHNQRLFSASDPEAAREEMEVNYFGVLAMCRAFSPILAENGGGAIVNVLSAAALANVPVMGGYSPSKAAARSLTAALRAELGHLGITAHALIVGSVDTRMAAHVRGDKAEPADIARAGLAAIRHDLPEVDTDPMAVSVRAAIARDPREFERQMTAMLSSPTLHTGRG